MATSTIPAEQIQVVKNYILSSGTTINIPFSYNSHFVVLSTQVTNEDRGRAFGFGLVSISNQSHCIYQPLYSSASNPITVTVEVGNLKITSSGAYTRVTVFIIPLP